MPDPDLQMEGGGGGAGGLVSKKFFRSFGPQFSLKIRGPSPGSATGCFLEKTLKLMLSLVDTPLGIKINYGTSNICLTVYTGDPRLMENI